MNIFFALKVLKDLNIFCLIYSYFQYLCKNSVPILEFLLLLGLNTDTTGKKILSWEYSKDTSLPRNIYKENIGY